MAPGTIRAFPVRPVRPVRDHAIGPSV
jgi:hypothetical protein